MGEEIQGEPEVADDIDDVALVARAVDLATTLDTDVDDQAYWGIVRELHRRGSAQIFDESSRLALSPNVTTRRLARHVLGRLGYELGCPFGALTIPLLAGLCADQGSVFVLESAIEALGHLGLPEGEPHVVAHARHPDPNVRLSVVRALPSIAGVEWLEQTAPAVAALRL